jgi:hypothetical protein
VTGTTSTRTGASTTGSGINLNSLTGSGPGGFAP